MNILLLGNIGQLGYELVRTLAPLGSLTTVDRPQLELTDPKNIRAIIRAARPGLLVNATAYTAVDKAESEPELARAINADAVAVMAEECRQIGGVMIHYSTDYVFDGSKSGPYVETDQENPLNVYGLSKLEGERALAASGAAFLIFRTSWLYGTRGANFLLTMLRLAEEREELRVVGDQIGAPTWCRILASATSSIVGALRPRTFNAESVAEYSGVYHLTASGQVSWAGFTSAILRCCSDGPNARPLRAKTVVEIPSAEYPLPAHRPLNSVLCNDKIARVFGIEMPSWCEQLRLALD